MRVVVLRCRGDLQRALQVGFRLAGKADDDVGAHRQVGYRRTGLGQPLEIALGGVPAVHQRQHAVAARLQRVVQVLAHRGRGSHRGERVGSHVFRVRAGEPHAAQARNTADGTDQIGEQRAQPGVGVAGLASGQLQIAAVAVDVLPEQGDFRDAVGDQRLHLGHDVVERAADLDTAHGRHDAERAVVVAADLDGDPRCTRCRARPAVRWETSHDRRARPRRGSR